VREEKAFQFRMETRTQFIPRRNHGCAGFPVNNSNLLICEGVIS
jgi:hypothetical protein